MRVLQELGASVVVDDFGTGYSSLLHLKQLSSNDFKIDRSFVKGLGGHSYDTAMVASFISSAHSLIVRCVAKGVETVGQLQLFEQSGCDFATGYLFSSPVDEPTPGSTSTCRQRRTELYRHPKVAAPVLKNSRARTTPSCPRAGR